MMIKRADPPAAMPAISPTLTDDFVRSVSFVNVDESAARRTPLKFISNLPDSTASSSRCTASESDKVLGGSYGVESSIAAMQTMLP